MNNTYRLYNTHDAWTLAWNINKGNNPEDPDLRTFITSPVPCNCDVIRTLQVVGCESNYSRNIPTNSEDTVSRTIILITGEYEILWTPSASPSWGEWLGVSPASGGGMVGGVPGRANSRNTATGCNQLFSERRAIIAKGSGFNYVIPVDQEWCWHGVSWLNCHVKPHSSTAHRKCK